MIPRLNRLPSTRMSSSRVFQTPLFTLRFVGNSLSYHRFAFVVSKRIDKRAVVRNRLKRVLREIAYEYSLAYNEGVDFLFVVKKNFSDAPRLQIEEEVIKALKSL
jgi:ribonuclease P protein component